MKLLTSQYIKESPKVYRKVCSRWVLPQLSDEHKQKHMGAALKFLFQYESEGKPMLKSIVTGDEPWVYNSPTKKQSMVWKAMDEEAPVKFKSVRSAGKMMCTIFWDWQGVFNEEYLAHMPQQKNTVTTDRYFDTIVRLHQAIKRKRPELLSCGVIFLRDNA